MLTQVWFRMLEQVQEFLNSPLLNSPLITPKIRAFRLTEDHEKPVLECYEYLHAGLWQRINEVAKNRPAATRNQEIEHEVLDTIRKKIGEDDLNLRWALLLHDLTKQRDVDEAKFGPQAHTSAQVVEHLAFLNKERCVSMDTVKWLVRYHDVLGNLLTGEQRAEELWEALQSGPSLNSEEKLGLLQIMTFCDMWGTQGGRFLTKEKVDFWLNVRGRIGRFKSFADYRINRWTGDEDMVPNSQRETKVLNEVAPETMEIFSDKVGRIAQGFYLFVAISEKKGAPLLGQLLKKIAAYYSSMSPAPGVINLQFDRYRDRSGLEHVLERYADAILRGLNFAWDEEMKILHVS